MAAPNNKSRAKRMQEASEQISTERQLRMTLVDDKSYEYHLTPYESVVRAILDPDVPDVFIEVPVPDQLKGSVLHAYLHTSRIARFYLHDELTEETPETPPAPEKKGG
jgi:hypothetical protein